MGRTLAFDRQQPRIVTRRHEVQEVVDHQPGRVVFGGHQLNHAPADFLPDGKRRGEIVAEQLIVTLREHGGAEIEPDLL